MIGGKIKARCRCRTRPAPRAATGRRRLPHAPMRAGFRSAAARKRDAMAQGRRPAPRRAAARSRHSPASGPTCRPAPPRGYTLRSRGDRKTTGRCIPAASGTDAETGRNAPRLALHWGHPRNRTKVGNPMKLAACISIALAISGLPSALAAAEQCRFIEARPEREACYQRQETARAARQKAEEARQADPAKAVRADDAGRCPARQIHARHLPGLLAGSSSAAAYCAISSSNARRGRPLSDSGRADRATNFLVLSRRRDASDRATRC